MTTGGWILVVISWGLILALCIFCFRAIFGKKAAEHLVAPIELEAEIEEKEEGKDEGGSKG